MSHDESGHIKATQLSLNPPLPSLARTQCSTPDTTLAGCEVRSTPLILLLAHTPGETCSDERTGLICSKRAVPAGSGQLLHSPNPPA